MNRTQAVIRYISLAALTAAPLMGLPACSSASGVGGGVTTIGGAPGTPCESTLHGQGCNGTSTVTCDGTQKTWQPLANCPAGQLCVTTPDPADPQKSKYIATCITPGGATDGTTIGDANTSGGQDGGAMDAGVSGADVGVSDAGVTDSGPADSGPADSGPADSGPADSGPTDSGALCSLPPASQLTGNQHMNKITKLSILSDKVGCDLDKDGVPNNVLGKVVGIYPAANDSLSGAVKDGSLVVLFAPTAWNTNGTPFTMDLLIGDIAPGSTGCNASLPGQCKYTVSPSSYDQFSTQTGYCPAKVTFDPTTVSGTKLKSGGTNQIFQLSLPVVGINLALKITQAQIEGSIVQNGAWQSTKSAMLCGVIGKDDLDKAIDAVPDEVLKDTGFDKATIKALMGGVMKPDIDTDNNGSFDAISVALGLETAAATVTGYK